MGASGLWAGAGAEGQMAERREQRESEALLAASQASLKQRKQRAEKLSQAGTHSTRQNSGCAQPCTHGPGPAQPPARSVLHWGKRNLAPHRACDAPKHPPSAFPLAQPAPVGQSRVSAPSRGTMGFSRAVPACGSTDMTACPGDHGGCTPALGWGSTISPLRSCEEPHRCRSPGKFPAIPASHCTSAS